MILGNIPDLSRLSLIDGQDFAHEFTEIVEELPWGSVVVLEMLNATRTVSFGSWPVDEMTIRIDADDHAFIPQGSWFRLWVTYPNDGGRFCWLAGPIDRNRR